jgi:hypothetical protein
MPHQSQLKKSSSLSKELPVRRLSLREDDDPGPLADDLPGPPSLALNVSHLTPRRSRRETQEWDTPSQRQVASTLLEYDYPQPDESCPMISPTRSIRFGSSQGFPYSQRTSSSQGSPSRRPFFLSQHPPSASAEVAAPLDYSQTQEMMPVSVHEQSPEIVSPQSLPPEVKDFHAMFEGGGEDESYPPDFPMSLRIVRFRPTFVVHASTHLSCSDMTCRTNYRCPSSSLLLPLDSHCTYLASLRTLSLDAFSLSLPSVQTYPKYHFHTVSGRDSYDHESSDALRNAKPFDGCHMMHELLEKAWKSAQAFLLKQPLRSSSYRPAGHCKGNSFSCLPTGQGMRFEGDGDRGEQLSRSDSYVP